MTSDPSPTRMSYRRRRAARAGVVLALIGAFALPAAAANAEPMRAQFAARAGPGSQPPGRARERGKAHGKGPTIAPAEAAREATRQYGGRVLNVVLEDGSGGPYYRVKLLDNGRVRVVHIDARR